MNLDRIFLALRWTGVDILFAGGACFIAILLIESGVPLWGALLVLAGVVATCNYLSTEPDNGNDNDIFPGGPPAAA